MKSDKLVIMKTVKTFLKIWIAFFVVYSTTACVHDDDYKAPAPNAGQELTPTRTLTEIRSSAPLFTGKTVNDTLAESLPFGDDDILEGFVISSDQAGNIYKNLFIVTADGKEGIMLSINKSSIYTYYPLGAKIYVKLKGLYYGKQNGMVQIGMKPTQSTRYIVDQISPNVMTSQIVLGNERKDEEDLVIKTNASGKPLTVKDVNNNEAYLCTLVELSDLEFNEAGSTFVREKTATNNQVNDLPTDYFTVRVSDYANFGSYTIPYSEGRARGVVTRYDGSYKTYQFLLRSINDLQGFDKTPPLFYETFSNCLKADGTAWASPWPKISNVTGFDMGAPVQYSDANATADVRSTASINKHVWFPANRASSLTIAGINTSGITNVRVSYKLRTNNAVSSDASILKVKCNGIELTIPPTEISNSGYVTIKPSEDLPSTETMTLEFYTTATLNTVGIRIDNIKVTGDSK